MNIVGKWNKKNYQIIKSIGKGNFGKVYSAYDSYGNIVAIKISKELLSLTNEYNGLMKFKNMAFVPNVYDFDDWEYNGDIWHFIVMDYIQGRNLKEVSKSQELNTRHAFKIGLRLLNIMREIDNLGYKYTDIKLENIILDKFGNIYLIDYGSLVEKDKPTKEYTQVYNINSWNTKYKYNLEGNTIFSINMIIVNLIGKMELNPLMYNLEYVIHKINKFPLKREEKNFLIKGLMGKFKNFNQYYYSLNRLLNREKFNENLSKIDYILIFSIVGFVFIFLLGFKRIFISY
ncbi:MAG: protein kinase [Tissierellia bacterium]|nr:protein kinase [Tissierellia bacterium]